MSKFSFTKIAILAVLVLGVLTFVLSGNHFSLAGEEQSRASAEDALDFFSDYMTWPSSTTLKPNDNTLKMLVTLKANGPSNSFNFIDINGDGLVDILCRESASNDNATKYGVLLNDGNNAVRPAYLCYDKWSYYGGNDYRHIFYGDCANVK